MLSSTGQLQAWTGARQRESFVFGISSMWEIRHTVWVTNTEHIPAMQNGHTLESRSLCVSMCVGFDIQGERNEGKKEGMDVPHRFLPPAHVMWLGLTPQLLPWGGWRGQGRRLVGEGLNGENFKSLCTYSIYKPCAKFCIYCIVYCIYLGLLCNYHQSKYSV